MSNDNYSAPVTPERLERLKDMTEAQRARFARFWTGPLDSMELSGLAEELEDLARSYRVERDRAVAEHQDGVRVHIVTAQPVSNRIHREDGNVAGNYAYFAKTEEEALDQFHEEVPVKVLEDFNIFATRYNTRSKT